MSSNQLSAFPSVMKTLVSLVELNLANNRIDRVTGIGDLVALVTLHLSDNRLCELPEEMSRLVKLLDNVTQQAQPRQLLGYPYQL